MSLIKCPNCGKDISKLASVCPNCGRNTNNRQLKSPDETYMEFCPICAADSKRSKPRSIPLSTSRYHNESVGNDSQPYRCSLCGELVKPLRTKYDLSHYMSVAKEMYGHEDEYMEVILEEIKQNPLFSEKKYRATKQKFKEESDALLKQKSNEYFQSKSVTVQNVPKCPTCGSTNIEKISTLSKAAGAYMFGLLSKTARSQFKCKNCGYKW